MLRLGAVLLLLLLAQTKINQQIGSGGFGFGCGSNSPLAQLPYGMMRVGPDTTPPIRKLYQQFQHFGGYSVADHYIRAISHMHLVGAGVLDLGLLGFLPTKDQKTHVPKDRFIWFDKMQEYSEPGYYSTLLEGNIRVELTATTRAAIHRYSSKNPMTIYLMPSYQLQKTKPINSSNTLGTNNLQGKIYTRGSFGSRFGGLNIYYYVQWFGNVTEKGMWDGHGMTNKTHVQGNDTGAYIKASNISIYVGISYVSIENAKDNLQKEIGNRTFDEVKEEAASIWHAEMSRFQITAINEQQQEKIDTAIYRTLQSPTIYSDYNGQYLSFADSPTILKKPGFVRNVYTDMSLWDVHRTQFPWILFHDQQRFNDIAWSIMLINQEGMYMPKWPFANGPTGCMIGAHACTVLADWVIKNNRIDKKDVQTVMQYMLRNANSVTKHDSRYDPVKYLKHGFIGYEYGQKSSCSETLEYSYNDFTIAQVAKLLNLSDIYTDFMNRSTFYRNLWNNQTLFFEPRYASNGSFFKLPKNEHTNIFSNYYVEGNAWHYRFYAPHDGEGLIKLFGGKDKFVKELEKMFKLSAYWPTFALPNPYYWAGNEHDLFSVWMFSYANRSDLVQKYSRFILDRFYGNQGNGLPGNDDYATMSAWLVFASLGFYPLPGTEKYILGSPLIHSAKIVRKISANQTSNLFISVRGNSAKKYLVESTNIDGKGIQTLLHSDLKNNSLLMFDMQRY